MIMRSIPLALAAVLAVLLGGCGEGQDYDRIYQEALAERVDREHAQLDEALPRCTSFGNRVVSGGPCVYGAGGATRGSLGVRPTDR